MGKRIRGPKPQLRDWTLLFLKKDGRDNRNKIAKGFAEFWDDMDQNVIKITGNCYLAGHVFGVNNTKNGSRYVTDRIISVERKIIGKSGVKNRFRHDLLCAETASGRKFFFYGDMFDYLMLLLMNDSSEGRINQKKDYYLHPDYCKMGGYL